MAPGLSSITTGTGYLANESRGGGWGYLPPKPQGMVGSALFLNYLIHLTSLLEGRSYNLHVFIPENLISNLNQL